MYAPRKLRLRSHLLLTTTILILGIAVACWRFLPWSPKIFFGDDLSNFLAYKSGAFASNPIQAAFAAYVEKYRPIFALLLGLTFKIFGANISAYIVINVVIQALNATLAFLTGLRLSNGRYLPAITAGVAAAGSRFALYQVTQVTGLVESVALTFCLLTLYSLACARESNSRSSAWRWSWLAVLSAFLSMHTHERYVVLAPWLCVALFFNSGIKDLPASRRAALLVAAAGTLIFNVVYKVFVLGLPFFVGTGGSKLGVDFNHVREQLNDALLSIGGLNSGPDYLIGTTWDSLKGSQISLLSNIFIICWAIVVIAGGICRLLRRFEPADRCLSQRAYWPVLLLALFVLLLVPPVLTIRLEQRWLFAPFVIALLLFAWASGAAGRRPATLAVSALAITVCACSIHIDTLYSRYFGSIFFVSAGKYAYAVEQQVVAKQLPRNRNVVLLTDPGNCTWTLQNGDFLRFYGRKGVHYACFGSATEALAANLPASTRVFSAIGPLDFEDVTQKWTRFAQSRNAKTIFDLIDEFPKGQINNPVTVSSSPSGHGVGIMQWNSDLGQRSTVTIITGFSYHFAALHISKGDQLRFAVGLIYPSHQPAHVRVLAAPAGAPSGVIFSYDVPFSRKNRTPEFKPISVPLSQFQGSDVAFTFEVSSPGGDITGHWVGFADPRIVDSTEIVAPDADPAITSAGAARTKANDN